MQGGLLLKIRDLHTDKGIFYYINDLYPIVFSEYMNIEDIDRLFIGKHGSRDVSPLVNSIIQDGIVDDKALGLIATMFGGYVDKWNNLINIYLEDIDLDTYRVTTNEQEDTTGTEQANTVGKGKATDTENVSGYDSDDMVADNSVSRDTNDEATSNSTSDNSRVLERTVKGNQGNRLKDRELALQLLDNNLLDTIFIDVSRELGLLIY